MDDHLIHLELREYRSNFDSEHKHESIFEISPGLQSQERDNSVNAKLPGRHRERQLRMQTARCSLIARLELLHNNPVIRKKDNSRLNTQFATGNGHHK